MGQNQPMIGDFTQIKLWSKQIHIFMLTNPNYQVNKFNFKLISLSLLEEKICAH